MKKFHLGAILSVIYIRLLVPRGLGGITEVYDLLNFMTNGVFMKHMTGNNLQLYVLGRVVYDCRPHLIKQFPQFALDEMRLAIDELGKKLSEAENDDDPDELLIQWLIEQVKKNKMDSFTLEPIAGYKPGGEQISLSP